MKIEVRFVPPEKRRTGCLTWVAFFGLILLGIALYGAYVGQRDAEAEKAAAEKARVERPDSGP